MNPSQSRHVKFFKNGGNQAVRIPRQFELKGNDAVMYKEGNRLIIEAHTPNALKDLLAEWEPIAEGLPLFSDPVAESVAF